MAEFNDLYQTADWKSEKHVPVIEAPETVEKDEFFDVDITLGKEVAHPNTTEHHIRWIKVYFLPEDSKFPFEIGKAEFNTHGESPKGPDSSSVYTHHKAQLSFKTSYPGTIFATSYCNIHGIWQNQKSIRIG